MISAVVQGIEDPRGYLVSRVIDAPAHGLSEAKAGTGAKTGAGAFDAGDDEDAVVFPGEPDPHAVAPPPTQDAGSSPPVHLTYHVAYNAAFRVPVLLLSGSDDADALLSAEALITVAAGRASSQNRGPSEAGLQEGKAVARTGCGAADAPSAGQGGGDAGASMHAETAAEAWVTLLPHPGTGSLLPGLHPCRTAILLARLAATSATETEAAATTDTSRVAAAAASAAAASPGYLMSWLNLAGAQLGAPPVPLAAFLAETASLTAGAAVLPAAGAVGADQPS